MPQRFNSINSLYRRALRDVLELGVKASPRGKDTAEVIGAHYVIENPRLNVLYSPARELNYQFSVAEWLWIMLGFNDADVIVPYNKSLFPFAREQGPLRTFDGAYGPAFAQQLPYVIEKLTEDPWSRQALISIWTPRPRDSKDIPCTVTMQFLLREDKLQLLVYMRSNDVWLGMPYDIFNFTMLQNYVAGLLNVDLGEYHHIVGSMHLYQEQLHKAWAVIHEEDDFDIGVKGQKLISPLLTPLPPSFKSFYYGLSLMGGEARQAGEPSMVTDMHVKRWVEPNVESFDPVWGGYLKLLATRFMRDWDPDWLNFPYSGIVTPKRKEPLDMGSRIDQFQSLQDEQPMIMGRSAEDDDHGR